MNAFLQKSSRKDKRYMVQLYTDKLHTIHFGSKYDNYTIHKDAKRRALYLARHAKNEDWSDVTTAGFWSRFLLWEEPHLLDAIKALTHKGINVIISKP